MRKRKKDARLAQFKDYLFIKIIASDLKIILAILVQWEKRTKKVAERNKTKKKKG